MATRVLDNPRMALAPRRMAAASFNARNLSLAARRVLNFLAAAAAIVITAPLMLVIAVLVKLTTRGSVLYQQTRVGLDRRGARTMGDNRRRGGDGGGGPIPNSKVST